MRHAIQTLILLLAIGTTGAAAQQTAPTHAPPAQEPTDPLSVLQQKVAGLQDELVQLRHELARSELARQAATDALEELQQFITDHHEYGTDFDQYRAVKAVAERQEQQRLLEQRRAEYEAQKLDRKARQEAARAARTQRRQEQSQAERYHQAGFTPIGLGIYMGKSAYSYPTVDATVSRIDWQPGFGNYNRLYPGVRIDFSVMTISGSVINATNQLRNIGVAVTFFDINGNQVGHEIIEVQNARPDVPYPYTATIAMASNTPFASTTSYVLYADALQ
jgi:hypothetical protein